MSVRGGQYPRFPWTLGAIVVLAFLYKLVSLSFIAHDLKGYGVTPWDSRTYYEPALTLARSFSFHSEVRTPGYPAFLALLYRLTGDFDPVSTRNLLWIFVAQATLLSLGCIPLFHAIRRLTGREGLALLGAFVWAIHNSARYYANFVLTEALSTFLMCLLAYLLARTLQDRRGFWPAWAGAILFLLSLVRPSVSLLAVPVFAGIAISLLWIQRERLTGRRFALLTLLLLVVPLSAPRTWSLRNALVEGKAYYCRLSTFGIYAYGIAYPADRQRGLDAAALHRDHWNEFYRLLDRMSPQEMDAMYKRRIMDDLKTYPVPIAAYLLKSTSFLLLPSVEKPLGRYNATYRFRDTVKPAFWRQLPFRERAIFAFYLLNSLIEFLTLLAMTGLFLFGLRRGRKLLAPDSRGFLFTTLVVMLYWLPVHSISAAGGEGARFLLPAIPLLIVASMVALSSFERFDLLRGKRVSFRKKAGIHDF